MQLPDETIEYHYAGLMAPPAEAWSPLEEVRAGHYLSPERLEALKPQLINARMQIASERNMTDPPARLKPLEAGFIDHPEKTLERHKRKGEASELGRVIAQAKRLQREVDRVVLLGVGGSYLGARALFESLCHTYQQRPADEDAHGQAARPLRGQQRRQRRAARPFGDAGDHRLRPDHPGAALGGGGRLQVGRHPGDGRDLPGSSAAS